MKGFTTGYDVGVSPSLRTRHIQPLPRGTLIPDMSSSIGMKKPYPPTPLETPRVI